MSENDALIAAVQAKEIAEEAHRRLNRMNGSIDRLGTAVIDAKTELATKIDAVLIHQATQTGESLQRAKFLDSRRFVITALLALAAVAFGLLGALLASHFG